VDVCVCVRVCVSVCTKWRVVLCDGTTLYPPYVVSDIDLHSILRPFD